MDNLIYLDEYRNRKLLEEIKELKFELSQILNNFDLEPSGYFLSLEEMENMEREWEKESEK